MYDSNEGCYHFQQKGKISNTDMFYTTLCQEGKPLKKIVSFLYIGKVKVVCIC